VIDQILFSTMMGSLIVLAYLAGRVEGKLNTRAIVNRFDSRIRLLEHEIEAQWEELDALTGGAEE
jgi:hypothetical protein